MTHSMRPIALIRVVAKGKLFSMNVHAPVIQNIHLQQPKKVSLLNLLLPLSTLMLI